MSLADLKRSQHHIKVLGDAQSTLDESTRPIDPKTGEAVDSWCEEEDEIELTEEEDAAGFDSTQPKAWRQWMLTKPYIHPIPGPIPVRGIRLGEGYTLNGKKIQIITKIAEM